MSNLFRHCAAIALLLSVTALSSVSAQDRQPVVLQHGFLSDAGTWDKYAPWLESRLNVATSRYTTGWNSTFTTQANKLRESIRHLPDTTIVIGHSNGGIVARRLAVIRPVKGYVTVGTPHTGAPLARSVLNGTAAAFAGLLTNAAAGPHTFYGRSEFYHPNDWFRSIGLIGADAAMYLGYLIHHAIYGMNVLDVLSETVLTEMDPGSAFLSVTGGINSFQALSVEQAVLGSRRVAFASTVTAGYYPQWMIWKGLMPEHSAALSVGTDATFIALLLTFAHYSDYYDAADYFSYEKQAYAPMWLWAAAAVGSMDMTWCGLIGAGFPFCEPADGIVPVSHQRHPGNGSVNLTLFGPAHQEQINSSQFQDGSVRALRDFFQVQNAVAPQTGFSVRIEGSDGGFSGMHSNAAFVENAPGPVTYRWYASQDGSFFYDTGVTKPSYSVYLDVGQMYWIRVVVTSGSEQVSMTKMLGAACFGTCS